MNEEMREERLKKLNLLKEKGKNPFPSTTNRDTSISSALENFEANQKKGKKIIVAGRVMSKRGHGGSIFFDLYDGTGRMQMYIKKDEVGYEEYDLFENAIDSGDIVEVSGTSFVTKKGQESILVSDWNILTKSLAPLPDKWHGLQDEELRFRKRYLDILMNPELRELFEKKAKFWQAARRFLIQEGFTEVHTPTLETTTGGAEARPFVTHHNDFDIDVYLRISVGELWQKRLMGAGFPKTFEMGRVYRNEGSSPEHLQEFTNIEFYAAYMDFDDGLNLIERPFLNTS